MRTTAKIAAAVVRCVLALLCVLGSQGGAAWMFLDAEDDGED